MRGVVPRYTKLRYTGHRRGGQPIDRVAEGFHARVVQHECDHLDGIPLPAADDRHEHLRFTKELFPDEEIADD
jgi:peptide deformylase